MEEEYYFSFFDLYEKLYYKTKNTIEIQKFV